MLARLCHDRLVVELDEIASVKMVENRAHAEVAIVQAALGGKVMADEVSVGINSAMASTCM